MHPSDLPYPLRFINDEKVQNWFGKDFAVYHCEFNREVYSDDLFRLLGVEYSESLTKAVIKRRAEFLAGRYCAMKSLQILGINDANVGIGENKTPIWPNSIVGSISHSDVDAIAITSNISTINGLGIDLEEFASMDTVENVKNSILCSDEHNTIYLFSNNKPLVFTLIFSAKESFFKAVYPTVKRYFAFDAISVVSIDWRQNTLLFRLNYTLHEKFMEGKLMECAFQILPDDKIVTLVVS